MTDKFKSRTFWMTIAWMTFVPLGFVAQVLIPDFAIPIGNIVSLAGAVTLVYVAGNKGNKIVEIMKLTK